MMLELNPPQSPRLEVIATKSTFSTGRSVANTLPDASSIEPLRFCKSSVRVSVYGRMAVIASCAFLSFAADTIFMALVICMVEETDAIRLRISLRFAMLYTIDLRFIISCDIQCDFGQGVDDFVCEFSCPEIVEDLAMLGIEQLEICALKFFYFFNRDLTQ